MSDYQELQNKGLKATYPRLKILDLFRNSETRHLTAEDVFRLLSAEHVDIGLATIYRVLTQFEQAGLLMRNQFDSTKSVFELNDNEHHDHMVCVSCGKVEEFIDESMEVAQRKVADHYGFELLDHTMTIYGVCPDCRTK
ncbi:ferric iron uptake transcriptional regulator [Taylorella equigenitalis]|uniref:Ferric uptake regulation protein n=2 Tax=Taylorella equigenitalis TaxID=29575 RepID=A0A654KFI1_TAYEM|nr:ferric iron uptake transcriptional regulator [Taylorella equigenitalis]ADU91172.1 Ferric uptake regulation protein FUR [Taylorella equigenitalis MCE9]AFN36277.1 ferric ion uptake regulator [Taylorella equigenitalis ATCC 35865]ASY30848.1 transcriptional repressor [Taylorella equigenitalis]ASY38152.1 ferric iron uptake transcriptional regulator [Taylorella equigenitalis]ASY39676.1 transcriptional repressor [Taylorella equigenitalis]